MELFQPKSVVEEMRNEPRWMHSLSGGNTALDLLGSGVLSVAGMFGSCSLVD